MDRNQGNQGGRSGPQSGTDSRNLGNMDDDGQRRAAQKGGETSSREQSRDDQGQFAGTTSGRGGSSSGQGGSNQGHNDRQGGGSRQGGSGNQGGSNR